MSARALTRSPQPATGATARVRGDRRDRGERVVRDLAGVQRARMLSAMVEVCCERGAAHVGVAHVVKRSGVSRRTFYEVFEDREDCFAAAFEHALEIATERVTAACDPAAEWAQRIRSGLVALLSLFDEQPQLARLLVVESLAGGARVAALRARTIATLTAIVQEGAASSSARSAAVAPELAAEALVGAVLSILQNRLVDPEHGPLVVLASGLMSVIVLPYRGAAAARRELRRPAPSTAREERGEREPLLADPFKETGMRLTYRTVRVLAATAEHPGASNRLIGRTAEISDQGQISRLLGRLERIGLIANAGLGSEKGGPNAWTLTELGARLVARIGAHGSSPACVDRVTTEGMV